MRPALPVIAASLLASCSQHAPEVRAERASIVLTPSGGAAYFTLVNHGGPDRLIGASVPGLGDASIHETSFDGGVMRMSARTAVEIPAGGTVSFRRGGLHLMIDAVPRRQAGQSATIVLNLERQGQLRIDAAVAGPNETAE
jgi:copper(I)-binding protein